MAPRIFISYRREDAAGDAGRLADHLNRRFGPARIFLDIDTIDPGTDFEHVLQASLEETAALLVVIGPRWTSLVKADGSRRLDDPNDFVRREVEAALGRNILVVPVLVQGAQLPRKEDLPESLARLVRRQTASLDHAEFHDDAERLCDRLARAMDGEDTRWVALKKWWPAAAVVAALFLGFVLYQSSRPSSAPDATPNDAATPVDVAPLLSEASEQQRRGQLVDALATLSRARALAPAADAVRRAQEDVAMEWIRNVRVEGGKTSFADAIKPALTVVDAALSSATGPRRADLQAHSGWAAFLMWRDGNRQLDPAEFYRDALKTDPSNPYANAMLAHWTLFRGDDVGRAAMLFDTALRSGRATDAVRQLQWAAYGNSRTPETSAQLVKIADDMRRNNQRLTMGQAQTLWSPYYFALSASRAKDRELLLGALSPDDYIKTMAWAFDEYAANDEWRRITMRYYTALLHERAGRIDDAVEHLKALDQELARAPGSLRDAVRASLQRLTR
jgi:TIR domain